MQKTLLSDLTLNVTRAAAARPGPCKSMQKKSSFSEAAIPAAAGIMITMKAGDFSCKVQFRPKYGENPCVVIRSQVSCRPNCALQCVWFLRGLLSPSIHPLILSETRRFSASRRNRRLRRLYSRKCILLSCRGAVGCRIALCNRLRSAS